MIRCQVRDCNNECGFRCQKHARDILFCRQHANDCPIIGWSVDDFLCVIAPWIRQNNQMSKKQIKQRLIAEHTKGIERTKIIKSIPNFYKAIEQIKENPQFVLN